MNSYSNTSIYKETIKAIEQISNILEHSQKNIINKKIQKNILNLTTQLALALNNDNHKDLNSALEKLNQNFFKINQLLDLSQQFQQLNSKNYLIIQEILEDLQEKIHNFPANRKNILILSALLGQGHMSAAKAVKEGIESLYGKDYNIEIIDFFDKIGKLLNKATIKAYEGTTKNYPLIYKAFFEGTDAKWPVQLLNLVNYPLNATKLEKFFTSKNPHLVLSVFPIWDYITSLAIKDLSHVKFISLITDSITIHNVWVTGKPSTHIVANIETAANLQKLGAKPDNIKVFGFPVKLTFQKEPNKEKFFNKHQLNPKHKTILYLPANINDPVEENIQEIKKKYKDNLNLIIITGRNHELFPKLQHLQSSNTKIIGWTDQMPEFIKNADIIITKAGGATVMECIAAIKPMIITDVILGQEIGNAELIKLHDLGIVLKDANMTITEAIDYISNNYQRIIKNLSQQSKPEASIKIAEFLHQELS